MTDQKYTHVSRLTAIAVGILCFISGLAIVTALLLNDYRQEHAKIVQPLLDEAYSVSAEMNLILDRLNRMGFDQCSSQAMTDMRRELFLAEHVKDIGFLSGNYLICTTGLGMLNAPLEVPEADFVGVHGLEVHLKIPLALFEQEYLAITSRKGHFNVVYDTAGLNSLISGHSSWQLVYLLDDKAYPVSGQDGIYRQRFNQGGYRFQVLLQYSEHCKANSPYCVALVTDFGDWYRQYDRFLMISLLLVFIVSVLAVSYSYRWLLRSRSTKVVVKRAIEKDRFFCLFQPVVDLKTGHIVGCEALARYDFDGKQIYPDEFIPIIAASGKTWTFTENLIARSLSELNYHSSLPDGFNVNFNLFPVDIEAGRARSLPYLEVMDINRFRLVLEVTEDQGLEGKQAQTELKWLKQHGYGIALDDFGTGYSNLNQVRDLYCDTLKIDRSFIMDVEDGSIKSTLIPYIVKIAKELNLYVVAEGVENALQKEELRDMGVEYGQGWAFGKPMTAAELNRLVQQQSGDVV